MVFMTDVERALQDKREQLEKELARLERPPVEGTGISFGKRVGEGTNIAVDRLVDVEVHDQMRTQLVDVRRALDKLAEGAYGTCEQCGGPIAPERLEVRPWALLCVSCAART